MDASLARHLTSSTLGELAEPFDPAHADGVCNLIRRVDRALGQSRRLRRDNQSIVGQL